MNVFFVLTITRLRLRRKKTESAQHNNDNISQRRFHLDAMMPFQNDASITKRWSFRGLILLFVAFEFPNWAETAFEYA